MSVKPADPVVRMLPDLRRGSLAPQPLTVQAHCKHAVPCILTWPGVSLSRGEETPVYPREPLRSRTVGVDASREDPVVAVVVVDHGDLVAMQHLAVTLA